MTKIGSKNRFVIPLILATRSNTTECVFYGSIVVIQNGVIKYALGDPNLISPIRSTAKPFQLIPLIANGGILKFKLSEKEIAVMASSHNGEDTHVECIRQILRKAGLTEESLDCGTHPSYFPWITKSILNHTGDFETPINNNCSGNHAGMLLLCKLFGVDHIGYCEEDHFIQKQIKLTIAQMMQISPFILTTGLDGCGVPTYNIPLTQLANAYYSLATSDDDLAPLKIIRNAILNHPYMMGGRGRLDTTLISSIKIIAKIGAQGIMGLAVPASRIGIAIKIESGSEEAVGMVAIEILNQLGLLRVDSLIQNELDEFSTIYTLKGKKAGSYRPTFSLI